MIRLASFAAFPATRTLPKIWIRFRYTGKLMSSRVTASVFCVDQSINCSTNFGVITSEIWKGNKYLFQHPFVSLVLNTLPLLITYSMSVCSGQDSIKHLSSDATFRICVRSIRIQCNIPNIDSAIDNYFPSAFCLYAHKTSPQPIHPHLSAVTCRREQCI